MPPRNSGQPALLLRHYRGATTCLRSNKSSTPAADVKSAKSMFTPHVVHKRPQKFIIFRLSAPVIVFFSHHPRNLFFSPFFPESRISFFGIITASSHIRRKRRTRPPSLNTPNHRTRTERCLRAGNISPKPLSEGNCCSCQPAASEGCTQAKSSRLYAKTRGDAKSTSNHSKDLKKPAKTKKKSKQKK